MPKAIAFLTDEQRAQMPGWARKWIDIGLSTEPMDLPRFDAGARACYRYAGLDEPRVVVPVSSPIVLALAAPIASAVLARFTPTGRLKKQDAIEGAVRDAVEGAIEGAIGGAVGVAVRGVGDAVEGAIGVAVGGAVRGAIEDAVRVRGAIEGAVEDAVEGAVGVAVGGAVGVAVEGAVGVRVRGVGGAVGGAVNDAVRVRGAVEGAVRDAVEGAVRVAVGGAVNDAWYRYIGGQFWVGSWWWYASPSVVSYLREVCGLTLPGDLMDRALAYQATAESACWWWPHRQFVMVSDRPLRINLDARGRLHSESGPAIVWRDGWGVYAWHGVRVAANVIDTPAETITAKWIADERNAEVRRVLVERVGAERYMVLAGGEVVNRDDWGTLWEVTRPEPMRVVELLNSTPEPDGSSKRYFLRVPHTAERRDPDRCVACGADLAVIPKTAHEAVAWSYSVCPADYRPAVMS